MNKKERKHNIKVYTQSVENAKKNGGVYIIGTLDGSPLNEEQQYLIDLAFKKMKRKHQKYE